MTAWLMIPAVVAVVAVGAMAVVARHYRTPQVPHSRSPAEVAVGFEEIRFPTAGGRSLYGWWMPAESPRPGGALTVILVHGWGRNVDRVLPLVPQLHARGCDLLAFDARSHGSSDRHGTSHMVKFSEDVRAAVDEALERAPGAPVAVLGLSVGGAGAIHAAAHDDRIGAVVTVGAFASPADLMRAELRAHGVPGVAAGAVLRYAELSIGRRLDEIAPERQIARVRVPVLLVHGTDDDIVPVEHARRLAAAGGDTARLLLLDGRGHSDCDRDERFWPEVGRALEDCHQPRA